MMHHRMTNKDSAKMERLYEKYKVVMFNVANKILKDRLLAEDVVHQTFVKLSNKLNRIDEADEKRTKSFLCIVCRNIAIDLYNSLEHMTPNSDYIDLMDSEETVVSNIENNNPCDILIIKDSVKRIEKEIEKLPIIYRDVIFLEYLHSYTKKEIAELFNVSYDTIKKRSERARKKLAKILSEEELI